MKVKLHFNGGKGARRFKEEARLWWPPVDTDTH